MTPANATLADELTTTNSIYGAGTLVALPAASPSPPSPTTTTTPAATLCTLRLPSAPSIRLRLAFPPRYPAAPPAVLGTETVGAAAARGAGRRAERLLREALRRVWRPDEPCVWEALEEVAALLVGEEEEEEGGAGEGEGGEEGVKEEEEEEEEEGGGRGGGRGAEEPAWTQSAPVTEKKSVFVARAAPVASPAQARRFVARLLATDRRAARATHNVCAWRIRGPSSSTSSSSPSSSSGKRASSDVAYQDCDSDGETAAGGRLLHLLRLMDAWGVLVVVSRWYGGVRLGPDRFRIINAVAREAVVRGGFVGGGGGGGSGGGGGGGGGGAKGRR